MAKVKLNEHTMRTLQIPTDAAQAYYWDKEVTGFGVVAGKTGLKTFMVRGRVAATGERIKVKIGAHLAPRDDKHVWTVELARERAKVLLGQMAAGTNPNTPTVNGVATGPTVREGVETHRELAHDEHRHLTRIAAPVGRSDEGCEQARNADACTGRGTARCQRLHRAPL